MTNKKKKKKHKLKLKHTWRMKECQISFITQICHSCLSIFKYSDNSNKKKPWLN